MITPVFAPSGTFAAVTAPYRHFVQSDFLLPLIAEQLCIFFEGEDIWTHVSKPGFLELSNTDLKQHTLPVCLKCLVEPQHLTRLKTVVEGLFNTRLRKNVDVHAHKMTMGQRIRAHTDFGETAQTHRLIVQINRGWSREDGGLLMLMKSNSVDLSGDELRCYAPLHNLAAAFEITESSWHAVSPIKNMVRFTLAFSFYAE
jgi:hypothetical protein